MNIRDVKTKSYDELLKLLHEKQASVLNFRFRVSGGRVKNVSGLRETRKDIARVLTLLKAEEQKTIVSKSMPKVPSASEGPDVKVSKEKNLPKETQKPL